MEARMCCTGTCFIQKMYAPSSSLLLGKHLPYAPSPLRLNIFRLFVILCWPNYIVTLPRYFSFRLPHLNINTGPSLDELDKNIQWKSHFLFFSHWNNLNNTAPSIGTFAGWELERSYSREATHRFRTSNNAKSNPEIKGRNSIF
jgi:hypothetical protein